jgi:hypothetical protein
MDSPSIAVAIAKTQLVQAPTVGAARTFLAVPQGDGFTADPTVRAALADAEAQVGDRQVARALFFSPLLVMRADDPSLVLDPTLPLGTTWAQEIEKRMAQAKVDRAPGVPPFLRGLMLDVAQPGRAGLLISLAYPECGSAQAAA